METAGQALKLGKLASVPGLITTPMANMADQELQPDTKPIEQAGPFAGQDFIPAREVEETDTEMMERIATRDAGMIPEPSRVPEAAPAQDQGFLSR